MAAKDIVAYRNSILDEMERESEIKYAKEEGFEKGIEAGIEEGKIEVARMMKKSNVDLGDIMLYTGLSEQQIASL